MDHSVLDELTNVFFNLLETDYCNVEFQYGKQQWDEVKNIDRP